QGGNSYSNKPRRYRRENQVCQCKAVFALAAIVPCNHWQWKPSVPHFLCNYTDRSNGLAADGWLYVRLYSDDPESRCRSCRPDQSYSAPAFSAALLQQRFWYCFLSPATYQV